MMSLEEERLVEGSTRGFERILPSTDSAPGPVIRMPTASTKKASVANISWKVCWLEVHRNGSVENMPASTTLENQNDAPSMTAMAKAQRRLKRPIKSRAPPTRLATAAAQASGSENSPTPPVRSWMVIRSAAARMTPPLLGVAPARGPIGRGVSATASGLGSGAVSATGFSTGAAAGAGAAAGGASF